MGNPSFSFSINTFLRATIFLGSDLLLALNTSPKVPCRMEVVKVVVMVVVVMAMVVV